MNLVPDGACDCHAHVIEDPVRFPLWAGRSYEPPAAPLREYLDMLDRRGFDSGVLVQPSVYGFDNSCMLDALDRAAGRLSGIAVPAPDTSARELEEMHRRGVRGVRCNILNPGGLDANAVGAWQPILKELGWRVELHISVASVADLRGYIAQFQVPVVVDHMGRPSPLALQPPAPELAVLVALLREGACFVKLSAPYRLSTGAAPWSDVTPLAHALLHANASACLWGSDWPHTSTQCAVQEDQLFQALAEWCPDARTREIMLVEAPRALSAD